MTPYAELLASPCDDDAQVRSLFHALARQEHPDRRRDGRPGPRWATILAAYSAVKTEADRTAWGRAAALRAGRCRVCAGYGVTGTRTAKGRIKICGTCKGEGVLVDQATGQKYDARWAK